jgi:2-phospho-L-lactate guanylyltransferase
MQATVFSYEPQSGTGSVITDQGVVLPFDEQAFAVSGLRHLRPGQRLTIELDDARRQVLALSLGSILPDWADPSEFGPA